MSLRHVLLSACAVLAGAPSARAETRVLDAAMHHLRADGPREWSDFPEMPEAASLTLRFEAAANAAEASLRLRQVDVKQAWKVRLNGKDIGRLETDENDMAIVLALPPRSLVDGENTLAIDQEKKTPDDIRVGEISIDDRPRRELLAEATVEVRVVDPDRPDAPLPCRITVADGRGVLMPLGAASGDGLAVRTGVIYTRDGAARFGAAAGTYAIHAGRGFEYGLASASVTLAPGDSIQKALAIRREVPTPGYVACDTHVHTLSAAFHKFLCYWKRQDRRDQGATTIAY